MQFVTFLHCHRLGLNPPSPSPVSVTKINITNIVHVNIDMAANVDSDITVEVFDDMAVTTHVFMGQY
jgi:hypothetical protein